MKIVAITRILDEADIVEAFVRHTAFYADHHIFVDNGSHDGTIEILERLRAEGFGIVVYQTRSVSLNEIYLGTFMYNKAVDLFAADWVLCLDADEFIDDRAMAEGLKPALERLDRAQPDVICITVPMIEYRRSRDDVQSELLIPLRMQKRSEITDNTKVIVSGKRTGSDLQISGGNHFAYVEGKAVASIREPGLRLAHYAERSPYQSAAKWAKGWSKVLAAGPEIVKSDANSHYREPFRFLCDHPSVIFHSIEFMQSPANADLTVDPITYRGTPLRYTVETDDAMRAMRMVMGYVEELATRYGLLMAESTEARRIIADWDSNLKAIIGSEVEPALESVAISAVPKADPQAETPQAIGAWFRRLIGRLSRAGSPI